MDGEHLVSSLQLHFRTRGYLGDLADALFRGKRLSLPEKGPTKQHKSVVYRLLFGYRHPQIKHEQRRKPSRSSRFGTVKKTSKRP